MATTKTLLNNVLSGLRQYALLVPDGTDAVTDDYLAMLVMFINIAKEECEEAGWPWYSLRQTVTITLSNGVSTYTLTAAGPADIDTNDRSRLLYDNVTVQGTTENYRNSDTSLPQMFDVTSASESRLSELPLEKLERYHLTDSDETGAPVYFSVYNSGGTLKMRIWPTPDATYTLKGRFYIPQAELTAADLTDTLTIPSRAVWLKALYKANEERGSELGKPESSLALEYKDALAVAISNEQTDADITVILDN